MALRFLRDGYFVGKVGIGTNSPTQTLHVGDNSIDAVVRTTYTDGSYVDIHGYGIVMSRTASYIKPLNDGTQALYLGDANAGSTWDSVQINAETNVWKKDATEFMRLNSSGNLGIGTPSPASKLDVQGGMSQFSTTLTNNEDWENSPISINERGQVGSAQSADKYAPNLNFHWAGRASKSLWLSAGGQLNFGEYSSAGIPTNPADGQINSGIFYGDHKGTINTATTGATQTAGDNSTKIATTAYADAAAAAVPIGDYLPLAGGTMTGATLHGDSVMSRYGTGNNFSIYHNGTNGYLQNEVGHLIIPVGNVGIGTDSPGYKLTVKGAATAGLNQTINIETGGVAAGDGGSLSFSLGGFLSSYPNWRIGQIGAVYESTNSFNGALVFKTSTAADGGTEKMRITSSGNVGIGTTDPGANLQVYSTSNRDVFISGYGTQAQNTWQAQHAFFTSAGQGVVVGKANVGNDTNRLHILYNTSNGDAQYLGYDTSNNNKVKLNTNGNSHLNGGNVGIGTTNPGSKLVVAGGTDTTYNDGTLKVVGSIALNSANNLNPALNRWVLRPRAAGVEGSFDIYDARNSLSRLTIVNSGNVGIGTTSPVSTWLSGFNPSTGNGTFKLTSEGWIVTPYLTGLAGYYPGQGARPIVWADDSGTNLQCWDNSATDGISLRSSNGTTRLFVKENGNVGIGTSTPNAKLDIQGTQGQLFSVTDDLSGDIFSVADISGVPILNVNSSGLVTVDGPFTQTGGGATILSGTLNVEGVSTLANVGYLGDGLGSVQYTFQSANDGFATIDFGDVADSNIGRLSYNHNDNSFLIRTNNATALTLDSSQNAFFAGNINLPTAKYLRFTSAASGSSGTVLFGNTTGTGGDLTFKRNSDTASMFKITGSGNAEVTGKGTSAATISSDGSSTLTTKGYVDGLITGATIYRGAWDPSGGGYGSPDLSGVTQTSGYYYICSAAGTAEPNGTGTEPDTWAVGDWVIYNDVSGTGQWQKIDNSSVLSGVGTGQTVALWEGAGSVTDSETLGNAPITVSGNDTTFAGIATGTSFSSSTDSGININGITMTRVAVNSAIRVGNGLETLGLLRSYAGLNVATSTVLGSTTQGNTLIVTSGQGSLNTAFSSAGNGGYTQYQSGNDGIYGYIGSGSHLLSPVVNDNDFVLRAQGEFAVSIAATEKMRINSLGNATFAGSVTAVGISSTIGSATSGYFATNTAIPANQIVHVRDNVATTLVNSAGGIKISSSPGNDVFLLKRNAGATSYFALQNSSASEFITTNLATGDVGIGVTSPDSKLDIGGDLLISASKTNATNKTNRIKGQHYTNAEEPVTFMFSNNFSTTNTLFIGGGSTIENAVTSIGFYTGANNTTTQGSLAMLIDSSQNVGIGTTNPSAKLNIGSAYNDAFVLTDGRTAANTSTFDSSIVWDAFYSDAAKITLTHNDFNTTYRRLHFDIGGNELMSIKANGNVGIGTTDPLAKLHIKNSSDTQFLLDGENKIALYQDSHWYSYMYFGAYNDNGTEVYGATNRSAWRWFVKHDGDSSPQTMSLYGANQGTAGSAITWNTVGFSQDEDGNVGIGTTTPSSKLQVAGGIQMANDTDTASATKVGTMRYRTGTEYVEVDGVDLADGWTFTSGWNAFGGGTSITNSTTFVSESGQGIYTGLGLATSKTYKVVIAGTQPSGGYITIKAGTTGTSFGNISEQSFDKVLYATLTTVSGNTNSFYIRLADHASNTSIVITKLEIQEVTAEDASYADMCMQTGASTYEWVNIVRNTY